MCIQKSALFGACAVIALMAGRASAQLTGPSSSASPYITPIAPGVITQSLLTVGDTIGGYRMAGIPDGLGALDNGDGTLSVFMNHELGDTSGVTRAHGSKGAFVSEWRIDKASRQVLSGGDLITSVTQFDKSAGAFFSGTTAFNRFCSADLPALTAFYNPASGLGTTDRIFMNGEESGNEGRAWGTLVTGPAKGSTQELPHLGRFSWENSVASPHAGDKTVVIGTDDSTPGQVYMYIGNKQAAGNSFEKAGLVGGSVYGVRAGGVAVEDRAGGLGGSSVPFTMVSLGDQSLKTGAVLQSESSAAGVTEFLRPEDGHWDPSNPNRFLFVTTDRFDTVKTGEGSQIGRSRLWSMTFTDVDNPELGGELDMLLDGTEAIQMMDNMTVDGYGNVLIQEDPGNQAHSAKIWNYNIASDTLTLLASHDVSRFGDLGVSPTSPFSADEESSGIIDASALFGPGWFLLDVQAHYGLTDPELVQGGQLLAFCNPFSVPAPGVLTLAGLAGLMASRRRR
ncbi:MAG: DUF839 domain-containing protein [Phycisphaerales bacterium]|nr:DUF839 domain-containing protein [Phycisphaerales bacterium]